MNIVVFGANGNIGRSVVQEALDRGHSVTAAVRYTFKMPRLGKALTIVEADVLSATSVADVVKGHDAIVSSIGGLGHDNPRVSIESGCAIVEGMKTSGVRRLLVVGTAGTLLGKDGILRMDGPKFPKHIHQEAASQRVLYEYLKTLDSDIIAWSYFAPPVDVLPGKRTGKYLLGADHLLFDPQGRSYISNEDYAVALLDEIENPRHIGQRFTAIGG